MEEVGCRTLRARSRIRSAGAGALLLILGGCAAPRPHMMATPVLYKDPQLDFMPHVRAPLRTTEVPVYYATTREPVEPGDAGHYSNAPAKDVRLGIAQVRLGEPGWTFDQLAESDWTSSVAEPRSGEVESIEELGVVPRELAMSDVERQLVARIDARLAMLRNPMVVLYVPGYRVTFDEVAVMMGSLSTYLGRGVVVTFQWPTGQNFWNYLTDCSRAEKYIPDIERLIALLSQTKALKINIIAYSCGSPLLAEALVRLRNRDPQANTAELLKRYRIGNVIFAGSDLDLKTFAHDLMPPILDLASQTIVYYSRNDAALWFSSIVAGASRIGRPDIKELSVEDLERLASDPRFQAVDVTDVRGSHEMGGIRGHGYWYANELIANDVLVLLRFPLAPEPRCLVPTGKASTIWKIPENYPDCAGKRMLEIFPELRRPTAPPVASGPP